MHSGWLFRPSASTMFVLALLMAVGFVGVVTLFSDVRARENDRSRNLTAQARDPEDVDGRLDLVFVRFEQIDAKHSRLVIRTAEAWKCGYLAEPGENLQDSAFADLYWEYRVRGANQRVGDFECKGKGEVIFKLPNRTEFPVRRPTLKVAQVIVPSRAFDVPIERLHVFAKSRLSGIEHGGAFVDEEDVSPILNPR